MMNPRIRVLFEDYDALPEPTPPPAPQRTIGIDWGAEGEILGAMFREELNQPSMAQLVLPIVCVERRLFPAYLPFSIQPMSRPLGRVFELDSLYGQRGNPPDDSGGGG